MTNYSYEDPGCTKAAYIYTIKQVTSTRIKEMTNRLPVRTTVIIIANITNLIHCFIQITSDLRFMGIFHLFDFKVLNPHNNTKKAQNCYGPLLKLLFLRHKVSFQSKLSMGYQNTDIELMVRYF